MRASWVTTAEQLVGIAQTSSGLESIAEQLSTDLAKAERLVGAARAKLPEQTLRALDEKSRSVAEHGYGALPPDG
jgi:hypothetical protein